MLKNLRITNHIAKDENGDEKRYYTIERRVFLFLWRTELECTNFKKVSLWIKERLDKELELQSLE